MNRTFVMCKPDAVERAWSARSSPGSSARASRSSPPSCARRHGATAEEHYAEHADKPFYGELVAFLTRSPVFAMVVEGRPTTRSRSCAS